MRGRPRRSRLLIPAAQQAVLAACLWPGMGVSDEAVPLSAIHESGIAAGVVVHVAQGDGAGTVALANAGDFVVHRLVPDKTQLAAVRDSIKAAGLYGSVAAEHWAAPDLPYATHLAAVLVVGDGIAVPADEVRRVIRPNGLALFREDGSWRTLAKPFPKGMDGWSHIKHGPDGNPVSRDNLAFRKVPNSLRWVAGDLVRGSSAMRLANGRLLTWFGSRARARDAFSGVLLWEADVGSDPVLVDDRIYASNGNVTDACTGERVLNIELGKHYEFIVVDGLVVSRALNVVRAHDGGSGKLLWEFQAKVMDRKLKTERKGVPADSLQHLVAADGRVYFAGFETSRIEIKPTPVKKKDEVMAGLEADEEEEPGILEVKIDKKPVEMFETVNTPSLFGLDLKTGKQEWLFQDRNLIDEFTAVVLRADGTLLALNLRGFMGIDTRNRHGPWFVPTYGKYDEKSKQWRPARPLNSGLPRGVLHIGGLLWIRNNVGNADGPFPKEKPMSKCWAGLDPKTGELMRWVGYPPAKVQWSGRCYWDIGAPDCILAQTLEIVTVDGKVLEHVRGVRGQCGMGFIVGHNSVFTSPNVCIYCYPMVRGAVAYELPDRRLAVADASRLEKGPAYGNAEGGMRNAELRNPMRIARPDTWPMYRGGTWRNHASAMKLDPGALRVLWQAPMGGRCTQAVVGKGKVVAAVINEHRVVALDADTGRQAWEVSAGGRIDTAPTLCGDFCVFGCHDGHVYCVRLADGALVWRFNAAPRRRRIVAGRQISSPWPVVGSVLYHRGTVYATAGFFTPLDGGIHFWALDPATAEVKFHRELTSLRGDDAVILPSHWYMHQEDMLNNVLAADGDEIRLYDQHGGWELSAETGELVGQSEAVPQCGWPKGRLTPGDFSTVDRWPWCGWDRVTMIHLLRGVEPRLGGGVGMDPRNRWADWYKGLYFVFPDRDRTGIQLAKGSLNPIPWALPATLDELRDPKIWRKSPAYQAAAQKLWKSQRPGTGVRGLVFAGDTLWIAGSREEGGAVHALSMTDGSMAEACAFDAIPTFEGLSAARSRLFVACSDGKILCLGK